MFHRARINRPMWKVTTTGSKQTGGLVFLRVIGLVFLFSGASVGFMPSDDAARRRSQKAMTRGIMSRYATDKSALQTALCFRRRNRCQRKGHSHARHKYLHLSHHVFCSL